MKKVKQWEVLVWINPNTKEYDIRIRSDIDTHGLKGFKRLANGDVEHTLVHLDNKFTRTFRVDRIFPSKKEAEFYGESRRLFEKMTGGIRSIMTKASNRSDKK